MNAQWKNTTTTALTGCNNKVNVGLWMGASDWWMINERCVGDEMKWHAGQWDTVHGGGQLHYSFITDLRNEGCGGGAVWLVQQSSLVQCDWLLFTSSLQHTLPRMWVPQCTTRKTGTCIPTYIHIHIYTCIQYTHMCTYMHTNTCMHTRRMIHISMHTYIHITHLCT